MKLEEALWTTVVWVCVLFYAFAAGVACTERADKPEPVQEAYIQSEPLIAAIPAAEEPQERQLGPCEDTYLREDIPLSYELQAMLYGACLEYEVPYELALAVIEQETNFRNVTGDDGASVGFMQIQDRWWSGLMEEIGARDLTDPEDNFRTGCAILRQLLDKHGNIEDALTAYNRGKPGQSKYSRDVMERMQKYGE